MSIERTGKGGTILDPAALQEVMPGSRVALYYQNVMCEEFLPSKIETQVDASFAYVSSGFLFGC